MAVLAALALLAAAGPAAAQRASEADSGRSVHRVTVSDRGIVVDRKTVEDKGGTGVKDISIRTSGRDGGLIVIDDEGEGIVRIWSDARVPAGEHVNGDVVAIFGSVTVAGTVSRDVVAVFGSVRLESGAHVDGDVVSIGGTLEQAEGATIRGESVQLGFVPFTLGLPAVSILLFAVAAGWLVSLFMGWILSLLFPTAMLRVATVVEQRPAASFFLGILSVPAFVLASILLCLTVIGIPIAFVLPMLYMLVGYAGQLVATAVLGARLSRRSLSGGLMIPLLVGTLFVAALLAVGAALTAAGGAAMTVALFLSLSGALLLLGLGSLGTGAVILSRFGTRPREVEWQGPGPSPVGTGQVAGPASAASAH